MFRSFGAFDYGKTKDTVSKVNLMNIELSGQVHDQGTTYQCWAYSTTSMLRRSWKDTLGQMRDAEQNGTWKPTDYRRQTVKFNYNAEMAQRESSDTFLEMRNLLMMLVIPKRVDKKDAEQAAYLRSAIVRVSTRYTKLVVIFI